MRLSHFATPYPLEAFERPLITKSELSGYNEVHLNYINGNHFGYNENSLYILIFIFYFKLDIDECNNTGTFQCNTDQFCLNSEGSYSCECYHGYTKNPATSLCDGMSYYMLN